MPAAELPADPYVLLEDRLCAAGGRATLHTDPVRLLTCDTLDDGPAFLAAMDRAGEEGLHLAGMISYEFGALLEPRLAPRARAPLTGPLAWFGAFRTVRFLDGAEAAHFLSAQMKSGHVLRNVEAAISRAAYDEGFERIKAYIAAGDVYQINYTFPLRFRVEGDPVSLYAALRARQPVAHGGLLYTGERHILSLSPELFFEADGKTIRTRPMKGTIRRSADRVEDNQLKAELRGDPKSLAENLMIVDLLRNDVGRIAETGSVQVPDLFTVETYPSLHTLTSTVEARLAGPPRPSTSLKALFPCGSITGAPKIRAMEIIRDLEAHPRGAYTGAMGAFSPGGRARFNVSIRTITVEPGGNGVMGVGGGIVADSRCADEYDEAFLKARFLMDEAQPFDLIETMLWVRGEGITLLARHRERMARSAAWYHRPFDGAAFEHALDAALTGLDSADFARLRCLMDGDGVFSATAVPLREDPRARPMTFVISPERIDAADPRYRHKTTRRAFYDRAWERASAEGADEVVFLNDHGEVAEGSRTTVFVERNGRLFTPPLASGVLPGVLRADLLGRGLAVERPLTRADLTGADPNGVGRIYLGNAVRGLCPAHPFNGSPRVTPG